MKTLICVLAMLGGGVVILNIMGAVIRALGI